jgi:hypothetical protein
LPRREWYLHLNRDAPYVRGKQQQSDTSAPSLKFLQRLM